ncbi:hypothetical protein BCEP4_190027 [Burkholderia cepacia]|nr:hypothetical protein BCEP4_190027 [Burkholderia cepacia]
MRLRDGRGRHCCARDQGRGGAPDDRGRRREHDARAVRDGQGRERIRAPGRHLRYDDRLALRQSVDETAVWRRFDAGDGRERRGRLQRQPRRPGPVRAAQPAEGRACAAGRHARRGNRRGHDSAEERRSGGRLARRASARNVARSARAAKRRRAPGRFGNGRQRIGRQRRCVRAAARQCTGSGPVRPAPPRTGRRNGDGRRRAARDGHRARTGHAETAAPARHDHRPVRRDRAERGVCVARSGGAAHARRRRRRSAREPERRRNRTGPSARRIGRPARDHGPPPTRAYGRPLCALYDVHRRRPGYRDRDRTRVTHAPRAYNEVMKETLHVLSGDSAGYRSRLERGHDYPQPPRQAE